jgi:hypothetical protein
LQGLVQIIVAHAASVEQLEAELGREFEAHPLAPVLRSAPGLGPISPPACSPRSVTTRTGSPRERLRAFAGTAPVTRASGRSHYVKAARSATNGSATPATVRGASRRPHQGSPPAREPHILDRPPRHRRQHQPQERRPCGNVANKLLGPAGWCLRPTGSNLGRRAQARLGPSNASPAPQTRRCLTAARRRDVLRGDLWSGMGLRGVPYSSVRVQSSYSSAGGAATRTLTTDPAWLDTSSTRSGAPPGGVVEDLNRTVLPHRLPEA